MQVFSDRNIGIDLFIEVLEKQNTPDGSLIDIKMMDSPIGIASKTANTLVYKKDTIKELLTTHIEAFLRGDFLPEAKLLIFEYTEGETDVHLGNLYREGQTKHLYLNIDKKFAQVEVGKFLKEVKIVDLVL